MEKMLLFSQYHLIAPLTLYLWQTQAEYFTGIEYQAVYAAYQSLLSKGVNAKFVSLENMNVPNNTGCDGHPDVAQHIH